MFSFLLIGLGAFAIYSSRTNSEWFFSGRKAQRKVRLLGRDGARRFYFWLGVAFIIFGIFAAAAPFIVYSLRQTR